MCDNHLWLFSSIVLLALTVDCHGTPQLNPAAAEFHRHRVIQPVLHHARTKRELSSTRDENGAHHPEVLMTVTVNGEEYLLDLRLNEGIVPAGHTIAYQKDGEMVLHKPKKDEMDLCHYSGVVQGKPGSWAAVSTCHGVSGSIFDGQKTLAIVPAEGSEITSRHFLYNYDDLNTDYEKKSVSMPDPIYEDLSQLNLRNNRGNRYKRKAQNTQLRMPYNSNNSSRYVELLLVVDQGMYKRLGSSIPAAHTQMIALSNILNSIYSPLNIYIALVGVVVWSERDEITLTKKNEKNFIPDISNYRKKLSSKIPSDHVQLLNTGKWWALAWAYLNSMCAYNSAAIVADPRGRVAASIAAIMAHEMAHSFGIQHDQQLKGCQCPNNNCIMDGSDSRHMHWSSCSIRSAENVFEKNIFECLLNKPTHLFSSPTCGNGFVEAGEQCDCGVGVDAATRLCRKTCSDGCQLLNNVKCATADCHFRTSKNPTSLKNFLLQLRSSLAT